MNERRWVLWIVFAVMIIGLAVVLFAPKVEQALEPEPRRALVAIEHDDSGLAVVGPVEIEAGTQFTLHAVLEAEERSGETVYFTEASALLIDGVEIDGDALRPWDGARTAKVLWFSVEGPAPYYELDAPDQLSRFKMIEFFHPEWPSGWQVSGRLDPKFDDGVSADRDGEDGSRVSTGFGTQRYHVRVELFEQEDDLIPVAGYRSQTADSVLADPETFPAVSVYLPDMPVAASRAFGLTQIELDGTYDGPVPEEWTAQLTNWTRQGVAFSRLTLFAEILRSADRSLDELEWQLVDIDAGVPWRPMRDPAADSQPENGVGPGDLLRAGSRIVFLFEDRGTIGELDRDDLCFDFDRGAAVRPLSTVFVGTGELEWVRLRSN